MTKTGNIIGRIFSKDAGLQMRMTAWVAVSVLAVATLVMLAASSVLSMKYEKEQRQNIEDGIETTSALISQRMERMEYITKTAAVLASEYIDRQDWEALGQMPQRLLEDIECLDVVSFVLAEDSCSQRIYSAYNHEGEAGRNVKTVPAESIHINDDLNWQHSYFHEEEFWCVPFIHQKFPEHPLQCFSVPLYDSEGNCKGILCAMIEEKWVEDIVVKYKTNPNIDVTVYNRAGTMVVPPDDYILELAPEDLITQERVIDRLGWRLVFAVDRHVISGRLNLIIWNIAITTLIMLVVVALTIALVVRFVARPFVNEQQRTAEVKAAMERELQIAAETQRALVPHTFPPFPTHPEIDLHACLHPAREVGGDLYDYFIDQGKLHFCIGDVSGKGMPASLFMSATRYLFRSQAATCATPSQAVEHINRSLCTDNDQCTFVTFFYGCLNLQTGELRYCNAGHNYPVLHRASTGTTSFLKDEDTGMPLGVFEEADYTSSVLQLEHGDMLFLYTDGVTESMNLQSEELGDEATLECIGSHATLDAASIIAAMNQRVSLHAGGAEQSDDITMLCLRWN